MSALTDLCRDQPCYVRLPNVCSHDPATVVPAHVRLIGISGLGIKAPDIFACPACHACHDAIDRRRFLDLDRDYVLKAHYEGLLRWQNELWRRELITTGAVGKKRLSAKGQA